MLKIGARILLLGIVATSVCSHAIADVMVPHPQQILNLAVDEDIYWVGDYPSSFEASPLKVNYDPRLGVQSIVLYYRAKYLDLSYYPKDGRWQQALISLSTMKSLKPLDIPKDKDVDVEWFTVVYQNQPYYRYVDYSGLDIGVPHSEEISVVTNRCQNQTQKLSHGTDWFVRIHRTGKSSYGSVEARTL